MMRLFENVERVEPAVHLAPLLEGDSVRVHLTTGEVLTFLPLLPKDCHVMAFTLGVAERALDLQHPRVLPMWGNGSVIDARNLVAETTKLFYNRGLL